MTSGIQYADAAVGADGVKTFCLTAILGEKGDKDMAKSSTVTRLSLLELQHLLVRM